MAQDLRINEVMTVNASLLMLGDGDFPDWVELHNPGEAPLDISDYRLLDEAGHSFTFPDMVIASEAYVLVYCDEEFSNNDNDTELRAPFDLGSQGERLTLLSAEGIQLDEAEIPSLLPDVSFGRDINNQDEWRVFEASTPLAANLGEGVLGIAQPPILSHAPGFYDEGFDLSYTPSNENDVIRYTLDGDEPDEDSPTLNSALTIDESTTLRLRVWNEDLLPSLIFTHNFQFAEPYSIHSLALTVEEEAMFGDDGIYTDFNSGEEIPVHVAYFDEQGELLFQQNLGVRIHAPDGRDQKSLRLYARAEYGQGKMEYPFFDGRPYDEYKRLVLRNAGNDPADDGSTHLRDAFVHHIYAQEEDDNGFAAYRPVQVSINGEYWGLYNLRERQDRFWMRQRFGYDAEEVDFLEYDFAEPSRKKLNSGDWNTWEELKTFLIEYDMSDEFLYQEAISTIDVDNYIDYMAYQIFIGNQDWCNNNIKFYRPRTADGKWKWIMWDTEYGLATYHNSSIGDPEFNWLAHAMNWCGWGTDDWAWMFRNLLDNENFRAQYIIRAQDLLNTSLRQPHLSTELDWMAEVIEAPVEKHIERWEGDMAEWYIDRSRITNFTEQRPVPMRNKMAVLWEMDTLEVNIGIDVNDPVAGTVFFNTLHLDEDTRGWYGQPFPWQGTYLRSQTMQAEAQSLPGFVFSHWEGDISSEDATITFVAEEDMEITAVFESVAEEDIWLWDLAINEVMSQNDHAYSDTFGDHLDWIELYNPYEEAIDLSGLYITDDLTEPFKWRIAYDEEGRTTIPAEGHLLFYADAFYSERGPLYMDFGLSSSGEALALVLRRENDQFLLLDYVTVPALEPDVSYGRNGDGAEDWILFTTSTPSAPNVLVSQVIEPAGPSLSIFPNPAKDVLYVEAERAMGGMLELYSVEGRLLQAQDFRGHQTRIPLGDISSGIYQLRWIHKEGSAVRTVLVR